MKRPKTSLAIAWVLASLLLASCSGNTPEASLASAKDYLKKGDTKSATIQIKNALQLNPELAEARYLLGTTLLRDRNAMAAEIELRKALAMNYPGKLAVPPLAQSLLLQSQTAKLIDEFGKAQLGDPAADASLQTTLAAAYGVQSEPELAESALRAALKAEPHHAPALLVRARQKAVAGDLAAALSIMEEVTSKDPGNVEAWVLKGDLLQFSPGKRDDALVAYRKSIAARPDFLAGHVAIVTMLLEQNELDQAAKQLDTLKGFAAQPQTKYLEARLAFQRQDYTLAKALSQQLMVAGSRNPRTLELAGAVEFQLNALADAEAYLAAAVQTAPELGLARRLLIATYLRTGQPAKALATLNAAAGKDGLDPSLLALAGQVHLQNGDAKMAEEYFAKALKTDPNNAGKRTALAVTHLVAGQTTSAFDELQSIATTDAGASADMALISASLSRKEFDKALAAVARLKAKQPGKPLPVDLQGSIQLAQKDTAGARKSFEEALTIDPSYFAAAANLAALDIAENKPDDARKRFENLLATNPKNGAALLAIAELAAARGAPRLEVAALLNKAIEANPTDIQPRLRLIELHLGAKDGNQAATVGQAAVTAVSNSPELLDALGRAQLQSGDVNQAIATFQKLAAMKPLLPLPHLRLAAAHMTNKDPGAAEQSMRKALESKPDDLQIQRGLIFVLVDQKKVQDAMAMARALQKTRPTDAAGFSLEGDVHASQQDWAGAAGAYRSALRLQPSTDLAVKVHTATGRGGTADDGNRWATTWMTAHPKDATFLMYQADSALAAKDFATAETKYLAVLQIQPDAAPALNNLAWLAHQSHKPGGLAYAERANAVAPNQPPFMDTLAMLLTDNGDYPKAIQWQLKALERQPTNSLYRLNLAKIYLASGNKSRAKAELDALTKLGEKNASSAEASALLKTL